MARRESKPVRIDPELNEVLQDMKEKNDLSFRQASVEAAKILKKIKQDKKVITREIKF